MEGQFFGQKIAGKTSCCLNDTAASNKLKELLRSELRWSRPLKFVHGEKPTTNGPTKDFGTHP